MKPTSFEHVFFKSICFSVFPNSALAGLPDQSELWGNNGAGEGGEAFAQPVVRPRWRPSKALALQGQEG